MLVNIFSSGRDLIFTALCLFLLIKMKSVIGNHMMIWFYKVYVVDHYNYRIASLILSFVSAGNS